MVWRLVELRLEGRPWNLATENILSQEHDDAAVEAEKRPPRRVEGRDGGPQKRDERRDDCADGKERK